MFFVNGGGVMSCIEDTRPIVHYIAGLANE